MNALVLTYLDSANPYIVHPEHRRSNKPAGAVLLLMVDGDEKVVAYYNKALAPHSVTRCKLLSVILAVSHF